MRRFLPVAASLAILAPAAPSFAAPGFYATLAQPAAATKVVARETLWNCTGAECRASRSGLNSDMTECRGVSRRLGQVSAFIAGEKTFDAAQLEKCNAGVVGTTATVAAR